MQTVVTDSPYALVRRPLDGTSSPATVRTSYKKSNSIDLAAIKKKYLGPTSQKAHKALTSEEASAKASLRLKRRIDAIVPALAKLLDKGDARHNASNLSCNSKRFSDCQSLRHQDSRTKQTSNSQFKESVPTRESRVAKTKFSALQRAVASQSQLKPGAGFRREKDNNYSHNSPDPADDSQKLSSIVSPNDTLGWDNPLRVFCMEECLHPLQSSSTPVKDGERSPKRKSSENIEKPPLTLPHVMSADSLPQRDSPKALVLPSIDSKGTPIVHGDSRLNLSQAFEKQGLMLDSRLFGELEEENLGPFQEEKPQPKPLGIPLEQSEPSLVENKNVLCLADSKEKAKTDARVKAQRPPSMGGAFSLFVQKIGHTGYKEDDDEMSSEEKFEEPSATKPKSLNDDAPSIRRAGASRTKPTGFVAVADESVRMSWGQPDSGPKDEFVIKSPATDFKFCQAILDSPEREKAASADFSRDQVDTSKRQAAKKGSLFSNYMKSKFARQTGTDNDNLSDDWEDSGHSQFGAVDEDHHDEVGSPRSSR